MSVDTLVKSDLLPHKFKYVGFVIAGLCFIYALIHHFVEPNWLFGGLHTPAMIFIIGLIIVISSKEPAEDERVIKLRMYIYAVLSGLFIGLILFKELSGDSYTLLRELCSVLTINILAFHLIHYFGVDWIEKNKNTAWFLLTVITFALFILYDMLWLV